MSAQSSCCGPVMERVALIKNISQMLHDGHNGLAEIYLSISREVSDAEKQAFIDAAASQRELAKASLTVVVPDEEA